MGKKERHEQDLNDLLAEYVQGGSPGGVIDYILTNSNLPGPRANLELAWAFGDVIEKRLEGESASLWQLSIDLTKISAAEAPVNTPGEFLPFCGTLGVGAIGSIDSDYSDRAIMQLRNLANDPRWRMREAVCFGLQRLLAKRLSFTLSELEDWARQGSWLEMRAAAAGVAEPDILADEAIAVRALQLHEIAIKRILEAVDRKEEGFKVLRKALGYTLSVVVCSIPKEGFVFMQRLAATQDKDILWIVKQNLKKKRLLGNYPDEVEAIQKILK